MSDEDSFYELCSDVDSKIQKLTSYIDATIAQSKENDAHECVQSAFKNLEGESARPRSSFRNETISWKKKQEEQKEEPIVVTHSKPLIGGEQFAKPTQSFKTWLSVDKAVTSPKKHVKPIDDRSLLFRETLSSSVRNGINKQNVKMIKEQHKVDDIAKKEKRFSVHFRHENSLSNDTKPPETVNNENGLADVTSTRNMVNSWSQWGLRGRHPVKSRVEHALVVADKEERESGPESPQRLSIMDKTTLWIKERHAMLEKQRDEVSKQVKADIMATTRSSSVPRSSKRLMNQSDKTVTLQSTRCKCCSSKHNGCKNEEDGGNQQEQEQQQQEQQQERSINGNTRRRRHSLSVRTSSRKDDLSPPPKLSIAAEIDNVENNTPLDMMSPATKVKTNLKNNYARLFAMSGSRLQKLAEPKNGNKSSFEESMNVFNGPLRGLHFDVVMSPKYGTRASSQQQQQQQEQHYQPFVPSSSSSSSSSNNMRRGRSSQQQQQMGGSFLNRRSQSVGRTSYKTDLNEEVRLASQVVMVNADDDYSANTNNNSNNNNNTIRSTINIPTTHDGTTNTISNNNTPPAPEVEVPLNSLLTSNSNTQNSNVRIGVSNEDDDDNIPTFSSKPHVQSKVMSRTSELRNNSVQKHLWRQQYAKERRERLERPAINMDGSGWTPKVTEPKPFKLRTTERSQSAPRTRRHSVSHEEKSNESTKQKLAARRKSSKRRKKITSGNVKRKEITYDAAGKPVRLTKDTRQALDNMIGLRKRVSKVKRKKRSARIDTKTLMASTPSNISPPAPPTSQNPSMRDTAVSPIKISPSARNYDTLAVSSSNKPSTPLSRAVDNAASAIHEEKKKLKQQQQQLQQQQQQQDQNQYSSKFLYGNEQNERAQIRGTSHQQNGDHMYSQAYSSKLNLAHTIDMSVEDDDNEKIGQVDDNERFKRELESDPVASLLKSRFRSTRVSPPKTPPQEIVEKKVNEYINSVHPSTKQPTHPGAACDENCNKLLSATTALDMDPVEVARHNAHVISKMLDGHKRAERKRILENAAICIPSTEDNNINNNTTSSSNVNMEHPNFPKPPSPPAFQDFKPSPLLTPSKKPKLGMSSIGGQVDMKYEGLHGEPFGTINKNERNVDNYDDKKDDVIRIKKKIVQSTGVSTNDDESFNQTSPREVDEFLKEFDERKRSLNASESSTTHEYESDIKALRNGGMLASPMKKQHVKLDTVSGSFNAKSRRSDVRSGKIAQQKRLVAESQRIRERFSSKLERIAENDKENIKGESSEVHHSHEPSPPVDLPLSDEPLTTTAQLCAFIENQKQLPKQVIHEGHEQQQQQTLSPKQNTPPESSNQQVEIGVDEFGIEADRQFLNELENSKFALPIFRLSENFEQNSEHDVCQDPSSYYQINQTRPSSVKSESIQDMWSASHRQIQKAMGNKSSKNRSKVPIEKSTVDGLKFSVGFNVEKSDE